MAGNATKHHTTKVKASCETAEIGIGASNSSWRDTESSAGGGFGTSTAKIPAQTVIVIHDTSGGGALTVDFLTTDGWQGSWKLRDGGYLNSDDLYLKGVLDVRFSNATGVAVSVEVSVTPEV